jgi:phage/conjugal plasmid C-4 type zinc finger TraR family protein
MRDSVDKANELVQRELDSILARRQTAFIGESETHCLKCGEQIPEKRRQILKGCRLCVDCQEIKEKREKDNLFL